MNERQRLTALLAGMPSDKLPWYADLSYLYSSMQERGTLLEQYHGDAGYLLFHQELGAGICFYAPASWEEAYTGGITEQVRADGDLRIKTINTPIGSVREVQKHLPEAYTWAIVEHFVKELTDLKVMLYTCEHRDIRLNYERFTIVDASWGDAGYAVGLAPLGSAPLQRMLTRWAGVPATLELYMDHRVELGALFNALETCDDPIFEIICTSHCQLIEFPENLSAEITGRRFFERYNASYYRRRTTQLHRAGKKASIHNDGTLRGTFDLLAPCGFDVVEAVTPAPVGDIQLNKLREEAGPGIILWGGLPGALFSPLYSEEQFEYHLQDAVRVFKADGHCVLGVADQVPPDGLISRVKRVREVVDRFHSR
jgi:hypothetical protein